MSINGRIERLEHGREERMKRERQDFVGFLKRLDHAGRRTFLERLLRDSHALLPKWDSGLARSPLDLPLDHPAVVEWARQLENQVIAPGDSDAVDFTLDRLALQLQREGLSNLAQWYLF